MKYEFGDIYYRQLQRFGQGIPVEVFELAAAAQIPRRYVGGRDVETGVKADGAFGRRDGAGHETQWRDGAT